MPAELPVEVDCRRLLAAGGTLSGTIAATRLTRVDGLFRARAAVSAELTLSRDDNDRMVVNGHFSAPLDAQCQRCLDWMAIEVEGEFELDVVESANAADRDDDDLVYSVAHRLDIAALVEDEVLLACPMIPVHAERDCGGEQAPSPRVPSEKRYKPFAALDQLLDSGGDERKP